jgi:hypothetical protein
LSKLHEKLAKGCLVLPARCIIYTWSARCRIFLLGMMTRLPRTQQIRFPIRSSHFLNDNVHTLEYGGNYHINLLDLNRIDLGWVHLILFFEWETFNRNDIMEHALITHWGGGGVFTQVHYSKAQLPLFYSMNYSNYIAGM